MMSFFLHAFIAIVLAVVVLIGGFIGLVSLYEWQESNADRRIPKTVRQCICFGVYFLLIVTLFAGISTLVWQSNENNRISNCHSGFTEDCHPGETPTTKAPPR